MIPSLLWIPNFFFRHLPKFFSKKKKIPIPKPSLPNPRRLLQRPKTSLPSPLSRRHLLKSLLSPKPLWVAGFAATNAPSTASSTSISYLPPCRRVRRLYRHHLTPSSHQPLAHAQAPTVALAHVLTSASTPSTTLSALPPPPIRRPLGSSLALARSCEIPFIDLEVDPAL